MAVTFNANGITIANRSSSDTIPWAELESIRYRVWRGGHYWQFKSHSREGPLDFYVDGLTSTQLNELRETISSIQLPKRTHRTFLQPARPEKRHALAASSDLKSPLFYDKGSVPGLFNWC